MKRTLTFQKASSLSLNFSSDFGLAGTIRPFFAYPYWLASPCCGELITIPEPKGSPLFSCYGCGSELGSVAERGMPWFGENELSRLEIWLERLVDPLEGVLLVPRLRELLTELVEYAQSLEDGLPPEAKARELEELARAYSGPVFGSDSD